MLEKSQKTAKTIFQKRLKPYGTRVIGFYVLDVLLLEQRRKQRSLSVTDIRQHVYDKFGFWYNREAIRGCIECINNMHGYTLDVSIEPVGKKVPTKKFLLKTKDDEYS